MWEYYLFALFAFALLGILILFAKFLFASRKKPEDIEIREEKLLRLYRQIEDMMESFEEYAEEVREEIKGQNEAVSAKLADFEKHMDEKLKKELDKKAKSFEKPKFEEITTENIIKPVKPEPKKEAEVKAEDKKTQIPKSAQAEQLEKMKKEREAKKAAEKETEEKPKEESRSEMVVRLFDEGNDENFIAKQMNMTMSEVKLILQMYSRDV